MACGKRFLTVAMPGRIVLFLFLDETLFDAGFLSCKVAQIIEFRTTHLAEFVDSDRLDERRLDGENPLHAYTVGDLAYCEALLVLVAVDADHYAAILLDTLLVTLFDTVSDRHGVAGSELIELLFGSGESLLRDLD